MPMLYEDLLRDLVDEARQDEEVIGLLLTGSLARGDALLGTDIDLRYILTEGADRPYRSTPRDGVLVEQGYADLPTAREKLEANPMDVYAYLDGRILLDERHALAGLRIEARGCYERYQLSDTRRSTISFLLGCSRDKISVAVDGGDWLKAAFVAGTSSWQLMEGLWAANNLPLPPNSSVRPHLRDLAGPPDVEAKYRRLFLGDTGERVGVTLELIDWIRARLER
jgi:predicted nucleotidyltransferase